MSKACVLSGSLSLSSLWKLLCCLACEDMPNQVPRCHACQSKGHYARKCPTKPTEPRSRHIRRRKSAKQYKGQGATTADYRHFAPRPFAPATFRSQIIPNTTCRSRSYMRFAPVSKLYFYICFLYISY